MTYLSDELGILLTFDIDNVVYYKEVLSGK